MMYVHRKIVGVRLLWAVTCIYACLAFVPTVSAQNYDPVKTATMELQDNKKNVQSLRLVSPEENYLDIRKAAFSTNSARA